MYWDGMAEVHRVKAKFQGREGCAPFSLAHPNREGDGADSAMGDTHIRRSGLEYGLEMISPLSLNSISYYA